MLNWKLKNIITFLSCQPWSAGAQRYLRRFTSFVRWQTPVGAAQAARDLHMLLWRATLVANIEQVAILVSPWPGHDRTIHLCTPTDSPRALLDQLICFTVQQTSAEPHQPRHFCEAPCRKCIALTR